VASPIGQAPVETDGIQVTVRYFAAARQPPRRRDPRGGSGGLGDVDPITDNEIKALKAQVRQHESTIALPYWQLDAQSPQQSHTKTQ
jgi:hypothetical protein